MAAWQRGSVAAWQRGSVAAWQRGSVAAWQRGSVAAWQRGEAKFQLSNRQAPCRTIATASANVLAVYLLRYYLQR
ncbi:hypothetical protein [Carnimonas bestiolae]|uniref:hypothetical protein n=1 Tax=Carnimonas bestiolae TaxID=3402172 RepID=UPI003F4AAC0D